MNGTDFDDTDFHDAVDAYNLHRFLQAQEESYRQA